MARGKSNGHVTDDVTRRQMVMPWHKHASSPISTKKQLGSRPALLTVAPMLQDCVCLSSVW